MQTRWRIFCGIVVLGAVAGLFGRHAILQGLEDRERKHFESLSRARAFDLQAYVLREVVTRLQRERLLPANASPEITWAGSSFSVATSDLSGKFIFTEYQNGHSNIVHILGDYQLHAANVDDALAPAGVTLQVDMNLAEWRKASATSPSGTPEELAPELFLPTPTRLEFQGGSVYLGPIRSGTREFRVQLKYPLTLGPTYHRFDPGYQTTFFSRDVPRAEELLRRQLLPGVTFTHGLPPSYMSHGGEIWPIGSVFAKVFKDDVYVGSVDFMLGYSQGIGQSMHVNIHMNPGKESLLKQVASIFPDPELGVSHPESKGFVDSTNRREAFVDYRLDPSGD